jgi:hypothetical protein
VVPTAETRFLTSVAWPVVVGRVEGVGVLAAWGSLELADDVGLARVLGRELALVLVLDVRGFRVGAWTELVVPAGFVVGLAGDDTECPVGCPGTTDVRRAAEVMVGLFFSSPDMEGRGRWVVVVVEDEAATGLFAVVPPGGRVGGLVNPLPDLAVELAIVLAVELVVVPALLRAVDDVELVGRFAGAGSSVLEPVVNCSAAGCEASEAPVSTLIVVSSAGTTRSSWWTASTTSGSDMMIDICAENS